MNQIDDPFHVVDERRQGLRGERHALQLLTQPTWARVLKRKSRSRSSSAASSVTRISRGSWDLRSTSS